MQILRDDAMLKTLSPFLFVFLFLIVCSVPVLAYFDCDIYADSYIHSGHPTTNYGSETTMFTKNLTSGIGSGNYTAFVAFNVSDYVAAGQTISDATLFLRLQSFYAYQNETEVGVNVSNTTSFIENTITWSNSPAANVTQSTTDVLGTYDWKNFSVTDAVKTAYAGDGMVYLRIDLEDWAVTENTQFSWLTREYGSGFEPYLRVYTEEGGGCNVSDDYEIGSVCLDLNTFYTNDGCNYTTTDCPTGSYCVQLTPQMNVTSDLYENYSSCQIQTVGGWHMNCFVACFGDYVVWSNCIDERCEVCPADRENSGLVCIENDAGGEDCGYFTDTYYTNQSYISVPSWTVACGFPNGTIATVIDEDGETSNITDILTRAGNTIVNATVIAGAIQNTTDTCYDASGNVIECYSGSEGVAGLKNWLNAGMGSAFGSDIVALIVSSVCAVLVFINVKKDDKDPALLFGTFMVVASIFSFVGLLTMWFLVLEVTLIGVMIFWKAKGG